MEIRAVELRNDLFLKGENVKIAYISYSEYLY